MNILIKTLLALAAMLTAGCEARVRVESKPAEIIKVAVKPVPQAMLTAEVLACDRRSTLFKLSYKEPEEKPSVPTAANLKIGESGYIGPLFSFDGRTYVSAFSDVWPKPHKSQDTRIERVEGGFLVDCRDLFIMDNTMPSIEYLIPVVGKISKPASIVK